MKPTLALQGRPTYGLGLLGNLLPYERLALGFLAALCTVALLRSHQPMWLLSCSGVVAVAIVAVAWWGPRSRIGGLVRDFFSVPVSLTLFMLVGPLIADSNPWRADGLLASLDARWFGSLPEQWKGLLGRPDWLTDAASLAYLSYYWLPVLMLVGLYVQNRRMQMDEYVFQLMVVILAFFVAYFFAPALGPRIKPELENAVLGGGVISRLARSFLRAAEPGQLNAFPSGHTGVSVACLVVGWRLFPRWRVPTLLVDSGIIFSTVYLSFHYVVDLVAGAILGPLALGAAPRMHKLCEPVPRRGSGQPIEPETLI